MGWHFALIFKIMNCETFTYSAHETDYSVASAAGPQEAHFYTPHGAVSAAPLSEAVIRFWMWMHMQFAAYLEKASAPRPLATEPSHIFEVPSSDVSAPRRAVRVNRSMMRKLRRLQRLHPPSYFDGPSMGDELKRLGFTMTQYMNYMVRRKKWSRVQVFGLGMRRRDFMGQAFTLLSLRGAAQNFAMADMCHAILEPD